MRRSAQLSAVDSAESMTCMPRGTARSMSGREQRIVGAAEDQRVGIQAFGSGGSLVSSSR